MDFSKILSEGGMNMAVIEIVSWQAKPGVSDEEMRSALADMLPDLQALPGFQWQLAGKDAQGRWVDVYCWDDARDAHASNELMADKPSLAALLALLEADSVTMDVIEPLQASLNAAIMKAKT